jgi:hypothetical protein
MSSNERRVLSSPASVVALLSVGAVNLASGAATLDLAALEVVPQRGQSADRARRDRYECHNWAVEQTGVVPTVERTEDEAEATRAERIARVISGASIGAGIGGLIRAVGDKDPSNGVLAGAAVGAAVGAATGRSRERAELDAESNDYLRALSACLEGRGYEVALPSAEGSDTAAVAAAD